MLRLFIDRLCAGRVCQTHTGLSDARSNGGERGTVRVEYPATPSPLEHGYTLVFIELISAALPYLAQKHVFVGGRVAASRPSLGLSLFGDTIVRYSLAYIVS